MTPAGAATRPTRARGPGLTTWMLVAMVVGAVFGWAFPDTRREAVGFAASDLRVLATIFLRLIKSLIAPLIFSTLVVGIAGQGSTLRRTGRLAARAVVLYTGLTLLALVVGWGAATLVRPGIGVTLAASSASEGAELAARRPGIASLLEHMVPQSIVEAAAQNEVLQILVFSILFAVALAQIEGPVRERMIGFCEALAEVMLRFTGLVMLYAPIGIGAAVAATVSRSGLGVLARLGLLVLTLYGALLVFIVGVLLPLALIARLPLGRFLRAVREPVLIAFSAASSDAALPRALQALESFGVSRRVVAFALPTALSFNLTGSSLFVALAALFVAQAAGIALTGAQQAAMVLTLLLTTKGIAAVPRASLVILSATLASFGLPLHGVAVVLAVDALMDMARTGTNMLGHCTAVCALARWEGELRAGAAPADAMEHPLEGAGARRDARAV